MAFGSGRMSDYRPGWPLKTTGGLSFHERRARIVALLAFIIIARGGSRCE